MIIAHIVPYLGRAQGGPVFAVAAYAAGLIESGCQVEVFSVAALEDGDPIDFHPDVRVRLCREPEWGSFRRCPELWSALERCNCDVIHSHSLWTDVNRLAAATAQRRGVPHLLAPCGTLAKKALRHHWWKKLPVKIWFQARALRMTTCFHAKSETEYRDIRRAGMRQPVAIVANPIAALEGGRYMSPEEFRREFRLANEKKLLLYLGRLHPTKGIRRLIESWAGLSQNHRQWHLVLAGPSERRYKEEFAALAAQLGCAASATFTGELNDGQKQGAYAAADLFVMPSDFENFGNSIVEAMLSGLPVVTTTGTPWSEIATNGAGWWVAPTREALSDALREGIEMPDEDRHSKGVKAARLAARFQPQRAVTDLMRVYQWMLHRTSPLPDCARAK